MLRMNGMECFGYEKLRLLLIIRFFQSNHSKGSRIRGPFLRLRKFHDPRLADNGGNRIALPYFSSEDFKRERIYDEARYRAAHWPGSEFRIESELRDFFTHLRRKRQTDFSVFKHCRNFT